LNEASERSKVELTTFYLWHPNFTGHPPIPELDTKRTFSASEIDEFFEKPLKSMESLKIIKNLDGFYQMELSSIQQIDSNITKCWWKI